MVVNVSLHAWTCHATHLPYLESDQIHGCCICTRIPYTFPHLDALAAVRERALSENANSAGLSM